MVIFYNTAIIYFHFTIIAIVILFYNTEWWYYCGMAVNKNTQVNYHNNFNPTFSRVKIMLPLLPFCVKLCLYILGEIILYNIGYTNTMVIYCHSTVITKAMLLYNREWWYDDGMAAHYCGKKFYNIGPWFSLAISARCYIL